MAKQHLAVEIGLARPEELADIWKLYKRTYLETYVDKEAGISRESLVTFLATDSSYFPKNWQKYLETPNKERTIYVARHEGQIVGMVAPVFVDGRHRVTSLYVAPETQGMGVGTALMQAALSHHGNVDIYIGVASYIIKQLQHFYEGFGFKLINPDKPKTYPPDPISYIEMMRLAATG